VLSLSIGNLRLNPEIEETIIRNWSANWLLNAKAESEQVERRRNIIESVGQEKAIRQYADLLSRDLIQRTPTGIKETLKTLLMRTRMIIFNNDQLRRRMVAEQQELEDIIKWVEGGTP
jgi:D-arabinose 1-dehydrogenase-like Zn-dependent alcohol dehydrogenase